MRGISTLTRVNNRSMQVSYILGNYSLFQSRSFSTQPDLNGARPENEDKREWYQKAQGKWREFRTKSVLEQATTVLSGLGIILTPVGIYDQYEKYNKSLAEKKEQEIQERLNVKKTVNNVFSTLSIVQRHALDVLEEKLKDKPQKHKGKQDEKIAVVEVIGSTGTGKTQLLQDYAIKYAKEPQGVKTVYLIRAAKNLLELDYRELARQLSTDGEDFSKQPINDVIKYVNEGLCRRPGWVLMFDNVEKYTDIKAYLPQGTNMEGSVIISSRQRICDSIDVGNVGTISLENGFINTNKNPEAVKALKEFSGRIDSDKLDILTKELGNLPLAIKISGHYLKMNPSVQIKNYFEKVQGKKEKLRKQNPNLSEHNLIYTAVFQLSLEILQKKSNNKETLDILKKITFFAPDNVIPLSILGDNSDIKFSDNKSAQSESFKELYGYGYIDYQDIYADSGTSQEGIIVHSSINKLLYENIVVEEDSKKALISIEQSKLHIHAELALKSILGELSLNNTTVSYFQKNKLLIPHVEKILSNIVAHEVISNSLVTTVMRCEYLIANCYLQANMYTEAYDHLNNARNRCDKLLKVNSTNMIAEYNSIFIENLAKIDSRLPSVLTNIMHYYGKAYYNKIGDNNRVNKLVRDEVSGYYLKKSLELRKAIDENKETIRLSDIDNAQGHAAINFERIIANNEIETGQLNAAKERLERIKDAWNPLNSMIIRRILAEKVYLQLRDFDKALTCANEAINIMEEEMIKGNEFKNSGIYYNVRAKLLADPNNSVNNLNKSMADYKMAEKCREKLQQKTAKEGIEWVKKETHRREVIEQTSSFKFPM